MGPRRARQGCAQTIQLHFLSPECDGAREPCVFGEHRSIVKKPERGVRVLQYFVAERSLHGHPAARMFQSVEASFSPERPKIRRFGSRVRRKAIVHEAEHARHIQQRPRPKPHRANAASAA